MAIGVFFLDWPDLLVVWFALCGFLLGMGGKLFRRSLKQMTVLALFTLPVAAVRFFTIREGRRFKILFLEIYSGALEGTLAVFLRILCVSLVSGAVVFLLKRDLAGGRRSKTTPHPLLGLVFASVELYQSMLSDLLASFRSRGHAGFMSRLDGIYGREKKRVLGRTARPRRGS